jgi:hypothetical protein
MGRWEYMSTGGVCCVKKDVARVANVVVICKKNSHESKEKCKKCLEEASKKRRKKTATEPELREWIFLVFEMMKLTVLEARNHTS